MRSLLRNFLIAGILFCNASLGFCQFSVEAPISGGSIQIRNDDERAWFLHSLDLISVDGNLIPAPLISITGNDGEPRLVGDPGPFTFMLANEPRQVTYGNLGSQVTFPPGFCTVLTAGVEPNANDITVSLGGGGPFPVSFPIDYVDTVCAVPEPNGMYLIVIGLLGLLFARPQPTRTDLRR